MNDDDQQLEPSMFRILEPRSIEYGTTTIPYIVTRSERKRVSIEVHPNLIVLVNAPTHATAEAIGDIVRQKAPWILQQRRHFADLLPHTPKRRFVSGESHLYLGRKYRLKIHAAPGIELARLDSGYLHIYTNAPGSVEAKEAVLAAWYSRCAARVFPERLTACADHPTLRHLAKPRLFIRSLQKRWGSYSRTGRLTLNISLIRASRGCIDYVITHELCHLLVANHSPKFTRLLDRVMPDWRERKQQLERRLA